jgi:plasmid stabilization system protein ParE
VNVSFNVFAEQELNEAARYYGLEGAALADSFLREIQYCCDRIVEHPEAGPTIGGDIRQRFARRFPYAVIYTIRPDVIRILAIMNLKRRPAYWSGRE